MIKTVDVNSLVVRTVAVGFLPELMLSVSISVSRRRTVERSMLSTVFVKIPVAVATIRVPGPDTVVNIWMVCLVVRVDVTTTTSQASWYRMHSIFSLSKSVQIFTFTSEGVSPAVNDCHGASQNVRTRFTASAGVMSDPLAVMGVALSTVKPHSVEKVIPWSQAVTRTFDPSPVSVVAQTVYQSKISHGP